MNDATSYQNIDNYMHNITEIIKIGADYLIDSLGNCAVETQKGNRDFSLTTDVALEKIYTKRLLELYPDIPILGEELATNIVSNDYQGLFWAIDPIDGTVNFSRRMPEYGTSIALIEHGKPIAVGVAFPSLQETYIAGKGKGAYLNGNRIHVSKIEDLRSSILAFGDFSVKINYEIENQTRLKYFEKFVNEVLRVRMPGSAALQLAWVASGKADISLTLSNNAWDVQGGVLLVREAGGVVYDFNSSDHNISSEYTIASNPNNKKFVIDLISRV